MTEVEDLRSWLARFDAAPVGAPSDHTALFLTPLGIPVGGAIAASLAALDVRIVARAALRGWARLSTAQQVHGRTPAALERAARFERLWLEIDPDDRFEVWRIPLVDAARLHPVKRELRRPFGLRPVEAGLDHPSFLHPFHLPDPPEMPLALDGLARVIRARGRGAPRMPPVSSRCR